MSENHFPNLKKWIPIEEQEAYRTPRRHGQKVNPAQHTKNQTTKCTVQIYTKSYKGKVGTTNRIFLTRLMSEFIMDTLEYRGTCMDILQVVTDHRYYTQQNIIHINRGREMCHNKINITQFLSRNSGPQKENVILKIQQGTEIISNPVIVHQKKIKDQITTTREQKLINIAH